MSIGEGVVMPSARGLAISRHAAWEQSEDRQVDNPDPLVPANP